MTRFDVVLVVRYIDWQNRLIKIFLDEKLKLPRCLLHYDDGDCSFNVADALLESLTGFNNKLLPVFQRVCLCDSSDIEIDGNRVVSIIYVATLPEMQLDKHDLKGEWHNLSDIHKKLIGFNNIDLRILEESNTPYI